MDDETQRMVVRMLGMLAFWMAAALAVIYGVFFSRSVASRRIRPGRRASVVGIVVDAAELIPPPIPGEPPCVFWASQTPDSPPLSRQCRGRPFFLRTERLGEIRLLLTSHDCRGFGFRRVLLDEKEYDWFDRQESLARAELFGRFQESDADSDPASAWLGQDAGDARLGRRTLCAQVNIIRIGDHVAIRGHFERASGATIGYRDRVEAVPTYRVAGDRWELLPPEESGPRPFFGRRPLIVDRGSLPELRSPKRVLEPRWLGAAFMAGMLASMLVFTTAYFSGWESVANHPLVRWF